MTTDSYTPSSAMLKFLHQNPLCGAGLSFEQIQTADEHDLAREHSGGLYVLQGYITEGTSVPTAVVKMHDSWGLEYEVVVHSYDPDPDGTEESDEREHVEAYDDPKEACAAFFDVLWVEKEDA